MTWKRTFSYVVAVSGFGLMATGCSLVGFMAGSSFDSLAGDVDVKGLKGLNSLKTGNTIRVLRVNGDTIEGVFCGVVARPTNEYGQALAPIAHSMLDGLFPPNLGEPIKIVTDKGGKTSVVRGEFAGLDPSCIYLHTTEGDQHERVDLGIITTIIDTSRRVVRGDTVRSIVADRKVPCLSVVLMAAGDSTQQIPIQDISDLEPPSGHNAKYIGLFLGAAIDVALIISVQPPHHQGPTMNWGGWRF